MKIALCLRGVAFSKYLNWTNHEIISDFRPAVPSIFNNIIDKYDVDVFMHGWVNKMKWESELIKIYQPKKYIIEKQKNFKKEYKNIKNYKDILYDYGSQINSNLKKDKIDIDYLNFFQNRYSYAYSFKKVLELKNEYQKQHNIEYDLVIVSRFDLLFYHVPDLSSLDKSTMYFTEVKDYLLADDIIISGSKNMDIFIKLMDDIDCFMSFDDKHKNISKNKRYSIHYQLLYFLLNNSIKDIKPIDIKCSLYKY